MHPKVAEMRRRLEPVLRLALELYERGDRETRDRVATILGKYLNCEMSTREALRRLRRLAEEMAKERSNE